MDQKRPGTFEYGATQEDAVTDREFLVDAESGQRVRVRQLDTFTVLRERLGQESFREAPKLIDLFASASTAFEADDGTVQQKPAKFLIAGGFVRDAVLGKKPKDVDFTTNLSNEEVLRLLHHAFAEELAAGHVSIDETGKQFGVIRIRFAPSAEEYEIASFREDGEYGDNRRPDSVTLVKKPGVDVQRRDFTINGLLYDPQSGLVYDYVGGLSDADNKVLRFIGDAEQRIAEDSLRILRFVRFKEKTGFTPDPEAEEVIQKHARDIATLPGDRLKAEMEKTIVEAGKNYGELLRYYESLGLLEHLLPEVSQLKNCEQGPPYHMEGNVFEHTSLVVNALPEGSAFELVVAAALHDIGKPETRTEELLEGGITKVSFIGHAEVSSKRITERLNKLRFDNEAIKKIVWLVENHIRAFSFTKMSRFKALELVRNPYFEDLMHLAAADIAGSVPQDDSVAQENAQLVKDMRARYELLQAEAAADTEDSRAIKKLINGNRIRELYQQTHPTLLSGVGIGKIKAQISADVDEARLKPDEAEARLYEIIRDFIE